MPGPEGFPVGAVALVSRRSAARVVVLLLRLATVLRAWLLVRASEHCARFRERAWQPCPTSSHCYAAQCAGSRSGAVGTTYRPMTDTVTPRRSPSKETGTHTCGTRVDDQRRTCASSWRPRDDWYHCTSGSGCRASSLSVCRWAAWVTSLSSSCCCRGRAREGWMDVSAAHCCAARSWT